MIDFNERIQEGYYKIHGPKEFHEDALTYIKEQLDENSWIMPSEIERISSRLYDKAYQMGHSAGYYEVFGEIQDLLYILRFDLKC